MIRRGGAVLAAGAVLLMSSCGSQNVDAEAGGEGTSKPGPGELLRVEATEGPRGTELIVYVLDEAVNVPATARGMRTVELRCVDRQRRVIVSRRHPWPFADTDNGLTDAHVHQRVQRTKAGQVSRCELRGTRGPLSGELASTGFE